MRIGACEIIGLIGKGGMGEVYRARDTRLGRDVAIKTLPESFAHDSDRMARSQREAEVLASLNHPGIAAIYGLEEAGSTGALVMELVEGATLAERIAHGPIPIEEALPIAQQIAEALEYAHERGVIHRDLKPANIKITPEGRVKVLDFGLAKALSKEAPSSSLSDSPTLTAAATEAGMILGTAGYMSPEQAKGRAVDRRADIWAFGVVLYEMITGRRLFAGEDLTETLANVLKERPDLSELPAEVRPLVAACIEKDPRKRLQAIGDWRLLVADREPQEQEARHVGRIWTSLLPWAVAGAFATVAVWLYLRAPVAAPKQLVRLEMSAPGPITFPQISPDGRTIVFASVSQSASGLWKRGIDAADAEMMLGTQGATYPFWSPDGKNIAFFQQGALKRMAIFGGPAITICPAVDGRGGTWSEADVIVFAPGPSTGLFRVPAGGGTPDIVIRPTQTSTSELIRYPSFLPGGQHFIYQHTTGTSETNGLYVGSLTGETAVRLRAGGTNGIYTAGLLLFRVQETLMAQQFDLHSLRLSGEIVPTENLIRPLGSLGTVNEAGSDYFC